MWPQTGYASQNESIIHFGLCTAINVEAIEVYWPSGIVDKLINIPSNQFLIIKEGITSAYTE